METLRSGQAGPIRELQVDARLDKMRAALDDLEDATGVLEESMKRIIMPESGVMADQKSAPESPQCPLAEILEAKTIQIWRIKERLISLQNRIEI